MKKLLALTAVATLATTFALTSFAQATQQKPAETVFVATRMTTQAKKILKKDIEILYSTTFQKPIENGYELRLEELAKTLKTGKNNGESIKNLTKINIDALKLSDIAPILKKELLKSISSQPKEFCKKTVTEVGDQKINVNGLAYLCTDTKTK